jgi:sporulation protein YlmC with PRC-barrel domain
MLSVEQIEDWLGQEVLDADGERLGKLDEVFYSTRSGEAVFASVKSGLLGRHSDTVPLAGASVGRDYVRLAYTAEQIGSVSSEVGGQDSLGREDARRLGELYGIEVAPEDDFEGASAINQRRVQADEARRQAEELEAEAHRRAADAENARGTATEAGEEAAQKAERAEQARADAEQARAEAERLPPA